MMPGNPTIWPISAALGPQGQLMIAGCDTLELARIHGTPLYLFDEATIRQQCAAFRDTLAAAYAGETQVHYAGKALITSALVQIIESEGLGLDVVSGGELYMAQQVGFPASRIHMHGNAKPMRELREAVAAGIGQIVVDNLDELAALAAITTEQTTPQPIALRIAPGITTDTHAHIQTGQHDSKFGLPLDALPAVVARLRTAPGLQLVALHCHLGSQIFAHEPFAQAVAVLLDCAVQLRDDGILVQEINTGGGIGVPYIAGQQLPDIGAYAAQLAQAMTAGCAARGLPLLRLAIEPGRAIIARAGVALYGVVGRKVPPSGQPYLHLDGGMADNPRPALYGARYTAVLAARPAAAAAGLVHLAGRYCESGDVLLRDCPLPAATPGDVVALAAAGAYTLSMASNYNQVPRPAVLLLRAGQATVIRRRETYADLMRLEMMV